jgi:AAA+ superfamily predicted ATPase
LSPLEDISLDVPFGAHERAVLRAYVLAYLAARCRGGRVRLPHAVLEWHAHDRTARKLDLPRLARLPRGSSETDIVEGVPVALTRAEIERARRPLPPPSALQKRLDWVAGTLQLDADEAACLAILCRLAQLEPFRPFSAAAAEYGGERDEASAELVLSLAGVRGAAARRVFHRDGTLLQLGLIEDRKGGDFAPSETLLKLLRRRTTDPRVLEGMLLGESFAPTLELADFDHMGRARDEAAAILSGCLDRRERGVGMLFYGPPGTGKTELAALLGRACDARVVFAGELDAERSEPERADRLAHLALVSAVAHRAGRVIVAVDEADDIFTGVDEDRRSDRTGSKVFINRLVEGCRVPTIWITNHPTRLGDAVIRRMLRAVEFRPPGPAVRRRIVDRHVASLGLGLDEAGRARLAGIAAPPAVLASALRAASLGGGTADMAVGAALSLQRAMGAREPVQAAPAAIAFDAALSSADVDLAAVERAVTAAGPGPLSFLFTGLPGTGKSAFARHLAGRLGMEVLEKRASDLLGMFVGQTEAQIAAAFEEAADGDRFLIFDEADSLLLDRREAHRSWEIAQVNEMLTWMERHPLPFAATSNLADRLDPAVGRRFTFKVRFGAMTRDQIGLAFERHFGLAAPAAALRLDPLTPGDFAVVARRARVTGVRDADALANLLALEAAARPGAAKPIGFR